MEARLVNIDARSLRGVSALLALLSAALFAACGTGEVPSQFLGSSTPRAVARGVAFVTPMDLSGVEDETGIADSGSADAATAEDGNELPRTCVHTFSENVEPFEQVLHVLRGRAARLRLKARSN